MLRIGLDVTPLLGEPTGIHQHTKGLLGALLDRDDVAVSGWLLTGRRTRLDVGVDVTRRVPASFAARFWSHGGWPGRRLVAGPVDVAHGTNFLAPPGARSVVTIQDTTPLEHAAALRPGIAGKAAAISRILRSPTLIHATSRMVADRLVRHHGASADRIEVIPLGLSVPDPPANHRWPAPGYPRYVVVVGTTGVRKRVPAVIEAMEHLPDDLALVVVGPEGDDEPAVASARHRLARPGRIFRVTGVDDSYRAGIVSGAAALVMASSEEGFGFPPLEALVTGVPAVSTRVGALPELLPDMRLLDPTTSSLPLALAAEVERVIGTEVPETVRSRLRSLSWERHAEAMLALYRRAAAEPPGG